MKIETLVAHTQNLLPNPQLLPRLMSALENVDTSSEDLVRLIKVDPALTAKIIAASNGSFYGYAEACSDLNEAINRIGFQSLLKLVSICLFHRVGGRAVKNYYLDEGALWENAVVTAVTMEELAAHFDLNKGVAYTIGLLHSFGKLVFNQFSNDYYETVFQELEKHHLTLIEAEKRIIGLDHAEACSALLKRWEYPDEIRIPILYQYAPELAETHTKLTYCLHLTKFLVGSIGCNHGRDAWAIDLDKRTLEVLDIPEDELHQYTLKTFDKSEEANNLINLLRN